MRLKFVVCLRIRFYSVNDDDLKLTEAFIVMPPHK